MGKMQENVPKDLYYEIANIFIACACPFTPRTDWLARNSQLLATERNITYTCFLSEAFIHDEISSNIL